MPIVYRGISFPGYNKPIKSNKPGKKKMVLAKSGDKVRLVHFGDSSMKDYTQHKSEKRRKSYCARSKGIKGGGNDKLKANYRARKILRKC